MTIGAKLRSFVMAALAAASIALAVPAGLQAAPVTTPATGPVRDQATGITMPQRLGSAELTAVTDFQIPGLGFSYRYRDPSRPFSMDFYIYNKGQAIPSGIDAAIVVQEVEQALAEVRGVASQGLYKNLKVFDNRECQYGQLAFRCVAMSFEINGRSLISMLMLRGERGNFIKLRATFPFEDSSAPNIVDQTMRDFAKILQR